MKLRHAPSAFFLLFTVIVALVASGRTAHAAESYDNCVGTISSLPTIITSQGVWCLDRDLSFSPQTGSAILVQANNVTIDCNHFKLGGLSAGPDTEANGIRSSSSNTTVRNCNIRGFLRGIYMDVDGNGGHVIEDNRLEANRHAGMRVIGDGSVVRRNIVLDSGGADVSGNTSYGISATYDVDILDNTVRGVVGVDADFEYAIGISLDNGNAGVIEGNRISGLMRSAGGYEVGIYAGSHNAIIRGNAITRMQAGAMPISCGSVTSTVRDNITSGTGTSVMTGCHNAGNNTSTP